jgi:putative transcriptional regulator
VEPERSVAVRSVVGGPRLHFADDLLLEHTVGAATEGAALAVACHLAICGACQEVAVDLERIGDALYAAQG